MVPSFYAQMLNKEFITRLVEKNLADDPSLFLLDVSVSAGSGNSKVLITIDGDNGVSIEQCAKLSRSISQNLEDDNSINSPYVLEVTSPGVDQPLQLHRQYLKNIGRNIKVTLNDNTEKKGMLVKVENDFIVIDEKKNKRRVEDKIDQQVEIPFDQISKTKVQISFK